MFDKYINSSNIFNNSQIKQNISNYCTNITNTIKKKNKKLKWLIPYINYFNSNQYLFFTIYFVFILFFSKLFLNYLFIFLLFDSIILSIIILHKNSIYHNSRKLAKNIILLSIIYLNIFGPIISLILIIFLYFEFSKFLNKIIYKILETIVCIIHTNASIVTLIYPNINYIKYNKPFESTETESDESYDSSS
jgi:hypothetical protein